ncbi:MAG: amidohydrolase family protein [Myxococcota bacterium]|nr:amidohydrolase family protein [Myxococcota bacterium]
MLEVHTTRLCFRAALCAFTVFMGLLPACFLATEDHAERVAIRGGWLFDGVSDTRRPNTGLVIEKGSIVELDVDINQEDYPHSRVIELTDSETILPGFFDLHAHYNLDLVDKGRVEEVVHNGTIFLAHGVTSTWSAGEFYPERIIAHRDKIEAGEAIGPRLFVSGPYFGAFRCEYQVEVAADECEAWPNDISEQEIRDEVDKWAQQGAVSIKIKQATPEEARVIIDQAHQNGVTTAGHLANYNVEYDVSTRDAILMGMDRIEHQLTLALSREDQRSAETSEIVDLMLKHGVFYNANLQMYGGIHFRQQHLPDMVWADESIYFTPYAQELLERRGPPPPESEMEEFKQRIVELMALYRAGGEDLLLVGTDEPVYTSLLPGFAYHRELFSMTVAGLPPVSVLKAATINGAKALGVDDKLGSVEVGKRADLVIVEGNPLDDIRTARQIRLVIKEGVVHAPDALLQSAEGKIGPAGPDDHKSWALEVEPLRAKPVP